MPKHTSAERIKAIRKIVKKVVKRPKASDFIGGGLFRGVKAAKDVLGLGQRAAKIKPSISPSAGIEATIGTVVRDTFRLTPKIPQRLGIAGKSALDITRGSEQLKTLINRTKGLRRESPISSSPQRPKLGSSRDKALKLTRKIIRKRTKKSLSNLIGAAERAGASTKMIQKAFKAERRARRADRN